MTEVSAGDIVVYEPKIGVFPTGEKERRAFVENVKDNIIIRQSRDDFTNRIEKNQVVCVCSGGSD
jgi:hypothetical protein